MATLCQRIPFPHSVEVVEASTARCATKFALDLGLMEVDIVGDSSDVVNALNQPDTCYTLYGHLISDTKQIAQHLNLCQFMHVKWDGNSVAHSFAKRARHSQPHEVWMKSVPLDINFVIFSDFSP